MQIIVNGYTISEMLELNRLNLALIKADRCIEYLKRNKDKYTLLVILLAIILPSNVLTVYATGGAENIGITMYNMGKSVAKIICLLGWLADSIKCVLSGAVDGLGKISIKWVSFALIVKFLPDVVNWIFAI